ncbi:MAG: LysM peptidoglycan-binding domain-containing protein [Alkalispirochaetaceae bacterium]
MKTRRIISMTIVLFVLAAFTLGAQSLMDDPRYRELVQEAERLEEEASEALDEGEYDRAIELSNEAEEVSQEAEEYAERRVSAFRARGLLTLAENEIEVARSFEAEERYPDRWENANEQFRLAENQFSSERYQDSADSSREVLRILEGVEPGTEALDEAQAPPELPRYYIVRRIPDRRDCFWRIAGYDFVYGDPTKWKVLYEANKDVIQDPDNPGLIQPGQRFRIPSIDGEQRAGVWNERESD